MSAGRSWARHWARRSATARAVSPWSSDKVRSAPGRIQQPSWRVFGGAPGPPRTWSRLVTTQLEQVFPQRSRICQKKNGSELVSHITNSHYHEEEMLTWRDIHTPPASRSFTTMDLPTTNSWNIQPETSCDRDIQLPSSRLWPFTTAQCKGVRPHMSLASKK